MTDADYFGGHASLSEWLRQGNAARAVELAAEDLTKTNRLRELNELIRLPSVLTDSFSASTVRRGDPDFVEFCRAAKRKPYALRLRRPDGTGILARNRGLSIDQLILWSQSVYTPDVVSECTFEFERHVDADLALILVHNAEGIAVEVATGPLRNLSRGMYDTQDAYVAQGELDDVLVGAPTDRVRDFVSSVAAALRVPEPTARALEERGYSLANGMLVGYFEVVLSDTSIYFVDYNRVLGGMDIAVIPPCAEPQAGQSKVLVRGRIGSPGEASGRARLVDAENIDRAEFIQGDVLVCRFTAPELAPLMGIAAAVVTEIGGVLSHAAVLCRELGIPSVVGASGAMSNIPEGCVVNVDARNGEVWLL